ncbi:MAG: HAD-IA family hydrolase [Coriobacteriales bacterium]|jgi:pyrophosphatase PpaX|nr:HAD-IA family hydrolase [Coriobacteriales bacterium]
MSNLALPKAILFDLDGTLIDTRELILDSFYAACDEVVGYRLPAESILRLVGIPLVEQMAELFPGHEQAMVEAYRRNNALRHDDLVAGFPGTQAALDELAGRGLPMAVVTSKLHKFAMKGLEFFDLQVYFQFVIGSDDSTMHKPNPEPLLIAADRLGLEPEECFYIGDSPYDMRAAVAADMKAIGVEWGMFSPKSLLEAGANVLAPSYSELTGVLDSVR